MGIFIFPSSGEAKGETKAGGSEKSSEKNLKKKKRKEKKKSKKIKMIKGKSISAKKSGSKDAANYKDVFACTKDLAGKLALQIKRLPGKFKRVVILPLRVSGDNLQMKKPGLALSEMISSALEQEKGIQILERERLKDILKESELAQLGVIDESTAPKLGNFLGARALITGSLNQLGPKYFLNLRMIDAESAKILVNLSTTFPAASLDAKVDSIVVYKKGFDAIWRSAVFPGLGQMYMEEMERGLIYTVLGGLSAASVVLYATQAKLHYDKYKKDEADTVKYFDRYKNAQNNFKISLLVFALIYTANLVDISLTAEDKLIYYPISMDIVQAESGSAPTLRLTYKW